MNLLSYEGNNFNEFSNLVNHAGNLFCIAFRGARIFSQLLILMLNEGKEKFLVLISLQQKVLRNYIHSQINSCYKNI